MKTMIHKANKLFEIKNFFQMVASIILTNISVGILLTFTLILIQPIFAAEIPSTTAENVALNFIKYLDENYTIKSIEPLEQSDKTIGYLVNLQPQGYILVAGDSIRVPIKAYSLASNFDNLPSAYVQVLLNELQIDSSTKSPFSTTSPTTSSTQSPSSKLSTTTQPEETNSSYWEFLTQADIVSRKSLRSYKPDTFLLTTQWNQGYPYNKFNPKVGDELTLTGCTQTAVAQIMRYHAYPSSGSGVFNHTWSGKALTAVMNRPFNWSAMPNSVDGSVPQYQQDEVAALMRDLGVLDEANFGTGGTSAYFHSEEFERAFGYASVSQMDSNDPNFFAIIKNEINASRPVLLMMPNHATVADGYASDSSGKKIHVNLGWGGSNDDYYFLDQTNTIGYYTYSPNHTIYYNVKPCQGSECNPYIAIASGNAPVISSTLNDISIDNSAIIRIEVYDPDGDTVTLSATSSSNKLQTNLIGNLLTLTPTASNIFCQVTINAQSYDGTADKIFKVLVLDEMIYIGNSYDIGGEFADGTEIDQYKAYLGGNTTISGDNGYTSQGFYTWIKDSNGNTVVEGKNSTISKLFTAGIYTIYASLRNASTGSYYPYDPDHSGYTITVTCGSANATVSDLAASMGITLSDETTKPQLPESITSYKILMNNFEQFTIKYGEYVRVIGSSGGNIINVKSGGRVQCMNFVGANVLNIEDYTSDFTVYRSGATVYLQSAKMGTLIKIPATKISQNLKFANGSSTLVIINNKVMIGGQEITLTEKQLVSPVNIALAEEQLVSPVNIALAEKQLVSPVNSTQKFDLLMEF